MFHEVVWQYMQVAVGLLITTLLQIYQGIFQRKKIKNQLRFDRIMAMSLWPHFLAHPVYRAPLLPPSYLIRGRIRCREDTANSGSSYITHQCSLPAAAAAAAAVSGTRLKLHQRFSADSCNKRIAKIGQYLTKLRTSIATFRLTVASGPSVRL